MLREVEINIIVSDMCPNEPTYYRNRAASYMMLDNFVKGLEDAKKWVELNPTSIKVPISFYQNWKKYNCRRMPYIYMFNISVICPGALSSYKMRLKTSRLCNNGQ